MLDSTASGKAPCAAVWVYCGDKEKCKGSYKECWLKHLVGAQLCMPDIVELIFMPQLWERLLQSRAAYNLYDSSLVWCPCWFCFQCLGKCPCNVGLSACSDSDACPHLREYAHHAYVEVECVVSSTSASAGPPRGD